MRALVPVCRWLPSHCILSDRERILVSLPFLIRALIPSLGHHPPSSHLSKPNYLPNAPSSNIITLKVRASTHEI